MVTKLSLSLAALLLAFGLGAPNEAAAQKHGGTLTLGMYADLHTPDLHRTVGNPTAQMGVLVAESLVDYDEKCDIVPSLAESWEVTPDAKAFTFSLRKGVKFHNGKEFTAEDVKKNYEHFLDKKTRSPRRGNFNSIEKIEVIDKYTVKFALKEGDVGFLVKLRPLVAFITHSDSFESKPPKPIGTGPFEFAEWKPKQYVKVKRFKDYWKKDAKGNQLPYVDEVILRPITDATVRYTALRTGDVDWIWTLPFEQVPAIQKKVPKGIAPSIRGGARWFYLNLNLSKGPLKDSRLRQAIAYAIDKQALMDGLTWGIATPEAQPFFPGSTWYMKGIEDPYREANLDKARQLMKEAGYEKGVDLVTIVRNESIILNLATLAQAQLKKVGINLKFEVMDRAAHRSMQGKGRFDVNPGHLSYQPDPDGMYYRFFHSKQRNNYSRWNDPEYDATVEKARGTLDAKERRALYRKALNLINRDMPHIFLGHLPIAQASRTELKNMVTNCRGDVRWSGGGAPHAWFDK
jgi:peptide/nickel transport system substrate-binding protein